MNYCSDPNHTQTLSLRNEDVFKGSHFGNPGNQNNNNSPIRTGIRVALFNINYGDEDKIKSVPSLDRIYVFPCNFDMDNSFNEKVVTLLFSL